MMNESETLNVGGVTIEIQRDVQRFDGMGPETDPAWRYVDRKGHKHYATRGEYQYPTLKWVVTGTDGCTPDCCGETWDVGEYRCPECDEVIVPGTRWSAPRTLITSENYFIDGKLATKEEIYECIEHYRALKEEEEERG